MDDVLGGDVMEDLQQLQAGAGCLVLKFSSGSKSQGRRVRRNQSYGRSWVTLCGAILDFTSLVRGCQVSSYGAMTGPCL